MLFDCCKQILPDKYTCLELRILRCIVNTLGCCFTTFGNSKRENASQIVNFDSIFNI